MKNLIIVFLILLASASFGQKLIDLPGGFKDNAYNHVKHLTNFGIRSAGTKGETETIKYIDDYFSSLNLKPIVDTFDFQCYVAEDLSVFADNNKLNFKTIFINRYKDYAGIKGLVYFFNRKSGYNSIIPDSIYNKIIITKESSNVYLLNEYKPRAIIILNDSDLNKFNLLRVNSPPLAAY